LEKKNISLSLFLTQTWLTIILFILFQIILGGWWIKKVRSGILSSFLAGKQKNIEVRSPIIILGWWPKKKVRCGIRSLFLAFDNHIIILGRWPKIKVRSRILSLLLAIFIFSFRYLRDVTYNSGSRLCGRGLECYHHIIKPRSLKNYDRIKKLWVCCT
jgi:hypothetical protein